MTHAGGGREISPTARALLALEAIQNAPGITAARLGERLGVTERAARRYVAILREAGLPIDSVSGPYGGYQVGHGLRLPPLTFTAAEASGLVMAVLEGHKGAADPADLVGGALAKIVRVLPARVAAQVRPIRDSAAGGTPDEPDPAVAGQPGGGDHPVRVVRGGAAAAADVPARALGGRQRGPGDGGRPVGGGAAAQPLVPALLVAHRARRDGCCGSTGS